MPGAALSLAFFLSGAAGLIFQVVWFHRAGLVFGSSVSAVTVVLSAFMGGLALGNVLAARVAAPRSRVLAWYASLELIVAASGVIATILLPRLTIVLAWATEVWSSGLPIGSVRFAAAFTLMAVPATAMGATLPMLVGALSDSARPFGMTLGRLYGWNTLGALAGVLAADTVLIRAFGVRHTAEAAALLNIIAALLAFFVSRREQATTRAAGPMTFVISAGRRTNASRHTALLLPWIAAGSGAILLALELVWFRFLSLFVLSTTLAASLMVATVLGGIAAGGFAAGRWLRQERRSIGVVSLLCSVSGLLVVLTYSAFRWTTSGTQVGEWTSVLWFAVALIGPNAILSGALFTLLGDAFKDQAGAATPAAAQLTFFNTMGALVGPPIAAFVLLPALGLEGALLLLSVAYGGVAFIAALAARRTKALPMPQLVRVLLAIIIGVALFPFGVTTGTYFTRAASAYAADGSTILQTREGPAETIFLMAQQWRGEPVYHRLVTNGFSMTGTGVPGMRYMRAFAYWPMLLHRDPIEHALLICYGVGVTASAVLQIPSLVSLDVVEISPDIAAMSDAIYAEKAHPLKDARTRLHLEDGRFFLETTKQRFDLITGEPPPPRTPGAVNIYTEDYFRLMRDRLNPGGIVSYWLPVARPNPGTDIDTVIRAFCNVFDDCSLWNATPFDFMLIGSRDAPGPIPADTFARPWQLPAMQASLREIGLERAEQIGATFLGDASYLASITGQTPALTDDFPQRLRPSSRPSLSDPRYGESPDVRDYYQRVLDPARASAAFASSPFIDKYWPADLKQRSLPFFVPQRALNQALWDGGRPLAHIEDLHAVLTTTTLRTLPLWMLGFDDVRLRLAEQSDDGQGTMEYARGIRSLSGRDYKAAVEFFGRARSLQPNPRMATALRSYAWFMTGLGSDAAAEASTAMPASADEAHFWGWLRQQLQG